MKLDAEPRLAGATATLLEWARKVVLIVNSLVDSITTLAGYFVSGVLGIANGGTGASTAAGARANLGAQAALGFTPVQQGGGIGQGTNKVFIGWDGAKLRSTVDLVDQGAFVFANTAGQVAVTTSGQTESLTVNDTGASGANLRLIGNGGTTPGKYIRAQGGALEFVNSAYSAVIASLDDSGIFRPVAYRCKRGTGAIGGNTFNLYWTGAACELWIDSSNVGTINVTSDERVKKQIAALGTDRAAYLQIRPISYRYRDIGIFEDQEGPDGEFWGFSAQNLLTCIPKAVQGSPTAVLKDGTPQPMSVLDRPILAQTVLQVQQLIAEAQAQAALISQLRAELDILKGA